jgi:PST family polysaccharide transporter
LIPLVFGEAYRPAVAIIAIHVWGGVFVAMRAVLSKWIITEGLTAISLQTHAAGATLNVLANLALIPLYGGVGAAIATVISYAGASVLPLLFLRRARPILVMMLTAWTAPMRLLRLRK